MLDREGLILLTNDGDLANRLTHPRYGHEKEYKVLLSRRPDAQQLAAWQRGVVLEDGYSTSPVQIRIKSLAGKGNWLRVIMGEGHKQQIRETASVLGLPVVKIIRVRIGSQQLGGLNPGEWRYLSATEIAALKGKSPKGKSRPDKRVKYEAGEEGAIQQDPVIYEQARRSKLSAARSLEPRPAQEISA